MSLFCLFFLAEMFNNITLIGETQYVFYILLKVSFIFRNLCLFKSCVVKLASSQGELKIISDVGGPLF